MVAKTMMDITDLERLKNMPEERIAIKELVDRYNLYCEEENYNYIIAIDLAKNKDENSMYIVAHYDENGYIIIDDTDVLI